MTDYEIMIGVRRRRNLFRQWQAQVAWRRSISKAKRWKRVCAEKQKAYDQEEAKLIVTDTSEQVSKIIRQMAGINPSHGGSIVKSEFSSSGLVGYRSCTGDLWDNVIRAWEEDR